MAFRTNKVPAIEERTVSGSSVSFNSAFALPLKACKVSFSATQASGTPSPSTPLPISGVSSIGLTANSTPVSVSLGDTRYGGVLDVLSGVVHITHAYYKTTSDESIYISSYDYNNQHGVHFGGVLPTSQNRPSYISNMSKYTSSGMLSSGAVWCGVNSNLLFWIGILDILNMTLEEFKLWIIDHPLEVAYPMNSADQFDIQLSANELSSIIGYNTFSTDTGTLEITFADLQEKSASGSVATFNTALAMPLASCNIAVNAWQEGSGDPSPSNVRSIHGFSEVNATVGSGNLFDGTFNDLKELSLKAGKKLILQGDMSNDVYLVLRVYDENKTRLQAATTILGTGTRYGVMTLNSDISYYSVERSSQSGVYNNTMLSLGNTVKPYTPYVTPTIYIIQLGQEVYGAEVDVVNGVAHVTHLLVDLSSLNWGSYGANQFYFSLPSTARAKSTNLTSLCSCYKREPSNSDSSSMANLSFCVKTGYVVIRDDSFNNDVTAFVNSLTGQELIYELETPFDIQLTPTQIETLIGNNTIFADTGDVDLAYKDLDIAKRGSFREVFKLPS